MRKILDIDSKLLDSVIVETGESSESKAVNAALQEYIRLKRAQELISSWGNIIVDDYSDDALKLDRERLEFLDSIGRD